MELNSLLSKARISLARMRQPLSFSLDNRFEWKRRPSFLLVQRPLRPCQAGRHFLVRVVEEEEESCCCGVRARRKREMVSGSLSLSSSSSSSFGAADSFDSSSSLQSMVVACAKKRKQVRPHATRLNQPPTPTPFLASLHVVWLFRRPLKKKEDVYLVIRVLERFEK